MEELLVRLPTEMPSGVPESVPELGALLTQLLRCGEPSLVVPAIESLARLSAVDQNEPHLHALFAAEPSVASVLVDHLEPEDLDGYLPGFQARAAVLTQGHGHGLLGPTGQRTPHCRLGPTEQLQPLPSRADRAS